MTYQDEIINRLIEAFRLAVINYEHQPNLSNSQHLEKAKHELHEFIRSSK